MRAATTPSTVPTAPVVASNLAGLPPHIRERLAAEGVFTLGDWRRLGSRRLQLFGIVPSVVRQLDALASRGAS